MPTYTYRCTECGHSFDLFHSISDTSAKACTVCGAEARRMMGTGAGLIFKGSGFYETDYKRKNGGNGNGAPTASSASASSNGTDSASKGAASTNGSSGSSSESTAKSEVKKADKPSA